MPPPACAGRAISGCPAAAGTKTWPAGAAMNWAAGGLSCASSQTIGPAGTARAVGTAVPSSAAAGSRTDQPGSSTEAAQGPAHSARPSADSPARLAPCRRLMRKARLGACGALERWTAGIRATSAGAAGFWSG